MQNQSVNSILSSAMNMTDSSDDTNSLVDENGLDNSDLSELYSEESNGNEDSARKHSFY